MIFGAQDDKFSKETFSYISAGKFKLSILSKVNFVEGFDWDFNYSRAL